MGVSGRAPQKGAKQNKTKLAPRGDGPTPRAVLPTNFAQRGPEGLLGLVLLGCCALQPVQGLVLRINKPDLGNFPLHTSTA